MYICAELDVTHTQCVSWAVQQSILPPLSIEEGAAIGSAVLLALAVAWGYKLVRQLLQ